MNFPGLPTFEGKLVYMHSINSNEFWSALLEKAYAKLHGSYEALMGGTTCEALSDFTGGITEMFELDDVPENLFEILVKGFERHSMMGCTINPHTSDPDHETSEGLICGHAYSITKATTIEIQSSTYQLLRLRNPWGNEKEWNGPWSDKSPEWCMIDGNLKQKLGVTFDCDGEFWMSFDDFLEYFDRLEICNLSPECLSSDRENVKWNMKEFRGEWVAEISAGGCRNYLDSFHQNPQYIMTLENPDEDGTCSAVIALMQKNRRSKCMGIHFLTIGFTVYRLEDDDIEQKPQKMEFFKFNKSVGSTNFTNLREVSRRFSFEPGNYLIVPSTVQPNAEGEFMIRVFSENCKIFKENEESVGIREINSNVSKFFLQNSAIDVNENFIKDFQFSAFG